MENTCNPKECALFELLGGKQEQCPNYQEVWFTPKGREEAILIKDCAPRRTFLMIQDLYNMVLDMRKDINEARNESTWVQVVAEVLGKNAGVDLTSFVQERQRLQRIEGLRRIT